MRHNLSTLQNAQARRQFHQTVSRGGAALVTDTNRADEEKLWTTQNGTVYPVFILSLHNPDDTEFSRWVP